MQNLFQEIKPLLRKLRKPSRFIGGEYNAPQIDEQANQFNFCMVYPDTYEIGQSNQAVRILCNFINNVEGMAAQRSFLPDPESKKIFTDNNISMFSIESFSPLCEFDAIGITVSHDLVATNILEVLDFANIPIFSRDRTEDDPIVFGGGPMCCNPEPYHEFFDVITIGEGEVATVNALRAVSNMKTEHKSRDYILRELSKMDSIYVPSLYEVTDKSIFAVPKDDAPAKIKRAIYEGFSDYNAYDNCIVPYSEIIHDRLNVEVTRGCTRGCRFCQAGFMYRPVRERSSKNICDGVISGLEDTGYDEVSLTSLSTTDHSQIAQILNNLNLELKGKGVRISISSQRLDSFGIDMAKLVAGNKKGGLTFAIESGSQRLRDAINKNVSEDDIFSAIDSAFSNGWNRAKLYFIIGLPGETDEDLIETAELCERILKRARQAAGERRFHGVSLSVSCAIFVPKAQTPFMYDAQISIDEAIRRINIIRHNLHSKAINLSWHSPETSQIEAVLSRGDRKCSKLIYEAWKLGCKFDAWNDYFDYSLWQKAADNLGMNLEDMAAVSFNPGEDLPWSHIDFGVDDEFFVRERNLADKALKTSDCSFDKCCDCGVCKNLKTKLVIQGER